MSYKYRYEVAEEVLHQNGSNAEIQRRVMEAFPDSRSNLNRPSWYRRSWNQYGHCRGPAWLRQKAEIPPK